MKRSFRGILQIRAFLLPAFLATFYFSATAQQSTTPPATDNSAPTSMPATSQPPDPQQGSANRAPSPAATTTQSHDRVFFFLPNYLTVDNAKNVPPLTAGQKYKLDAKNCFDIGELMWYAAIAGVSQAANTDAPYGQGTAGYAKRYAVRFADGTIEDFMTRAVFASFLRQDPRYFRLGRGSVGHRTWYALSRIVVTRSDSGENEFNYSEVFGAAAAAGISTFTYHRPDDRRLGNALNTWGTQVGYDALAFLVREFWPDLRQKIHGSKHTP